MTNKLFVNGELAIIRKETHGKSKQTKSAPEFTSRMEKRQYDQRFNYFDIRNVLDIKGILKDIRANWNSYVSQVNQMIQKSPVKNLVVTGIFTIVLSFFASTANAAFIEEYTYQVKSGEKIEAIAAAHGVTPQEILEANGLTSINGKKILLPKVHNRTVNATTLNVRTHPTTESSIIGTYKKGEVVKVSFVENGWARILIKGRVCFVNANYLTTPGETTKPAITQAKTMYVNATTLRVREATSTSGTVIGMLKLNDRVSVRSSNKGWAQIDFNGKTAFVSETYLTMNKPATTKPSSSMYVIKPGDTFVKISKALNISVTSIQELNPTVDPVKLKIGQKINIPANIATVTTNQIKVSAQLQAVDPNGTFRFITANGNTYAAKASGELIKELVEHIGQKVSLTLEGKRGQQMTLLSVQ
ncbi:SH3 domain-containing protein [Bacillus sp. UNC41MFS5]|uniref:SH3 domain-containing protein n=1 Tax=Bacillus sp. UNC41MFS5 TaxID=1449046 RepID=UPI00047A6C53|nr:SH3 domain-containing protein [Bacillus sp. UNC41MFS5]